MKPRHYYAASLLSGVALVAVGIAAGSPWLIFLGCIGPPAGIVQVHLARRRMLRPHDPAWKATPDARVLTPSHLPLLPPQGFRWIGGCNVPGGLGRIYASFPLAVLMAAPGWTRIELRPRVAQRLFGYRPVTFEPDTDTTIYPARRGFVRGVGLQTGRQAPSYFWSTDQQTILTALAGCGFRVVWVEANAKTW